MELSISQKDKEPLLSRMRVCGELAFESTTPSNAEVRKAVASSIKADEKLVVVRKVHNFFGRRKAAFEVCVYDDDKAMAAIEPAPKKKGGAAEAQPAPEKKEEQATPEKKEEKAAPEKKEEPKHAPENKEAKPAEEKQEAKAAGEKKE
ncbi:TPA: hypothetical protein HA372_03390 [Candidatus Woesearchaeota archaeon]|nr:hypothetical protein [Candidatus Woesearchaeota archaeon]HII63950.1 hypothetical protein [Candidatus Woesearchaeota archaeon]HIJ18702.1 hypothetical protein [Candidatus Woesearchaeota archaeon]